jgi:hypothetical protein
MGPRRHCATATCCMALSLRVQPGLALRQLPAVTSDGICDAFSNVLLAPS